MSCDWILFLIKNRCSRLVANRFCLFGFVLIFEKIFLNFVLKCSCNQSYNNRWNLLGNSFGRFFWLKTPDCLILYFYFLKIFFRCYFYFVAKKVGMPSSNSLAVAQWSMLLSIIIFSPRFLSTKTMQVDIYSVRTYCHQQSYPLYSRLLFKFYIPIRTVERVSHLIKELWRIKRCLYQFRVPTHIVDVPAAHVRNL